MEARYAKLESKYLILLRYMRQPPTRGDDAPDEDQLTRLLEDAMTVATKDDSTTIIQSSKDVHDQFGFLKRPSLQYDDDFILPTLRKAEAELKRWSIGMRWCLAMLFGVQ